MASDGPPVPACGEEPVADEAGRDQGCWQVSRMPATVIAERIGLVVFDPDAQRAKYASCGRWQYATGSGVARHMWPVRSGSATLVTMSLCRWGAARSHRHGVNADHGVGPFAVGLVVPTRTAEDLCRSGGSASFDVGRPFQGCGDGEERSGGGGRQPELTRHAMPSTAPGRQGVWICKPVIPKPGLVERFHDYLGGRSCRVGSLPPADFNAVAGLAGTG